MIATVRIVAAGKPELTFLPQREKCSNTEFFVVRIQKNTDHKNSVFGNFSRSVILKFHTGLQLPTRRPAF